MAALTAAAALFTGSAPAFDDAKTIPIGKLASRAGVTVRTLRFYEACGLLRPARHNEHIRYFSARDEAVLGLVLAGKRLGMSLREIRSLLAASALSKHGPQPAIARRLIAAARADLVEMRREIDAGELEADRLLAALDPARAHDVRTEVVQAA